MCTLTMLEKASVWGGILYSSKAREGYAWGGIFVLEQSKGVLCLGRYLVLVAKELLSGASLAIMLMFPSVMGRSWKSKQQNLQRVELQGVQG